MILRNYLDYNATSPLANSVQTYLKQGDLSFANPASIHTSGKQAKSLLRTSSQNIKNLMGLPDYEIIFHSGATEAINTLFSGLQVGDALIVSSVDHPCVVEAADQCRKRGILVYEFPVDSKGDFDTQALIQKIKEVKKSCKEVWLNFTAGNNETGVVWPLALAEEIKAQTTCKVHVDAVQLIGKHVSWNQLSSLLDMYTFSSHKFGALKGHGFTLVNDSRNYHPLILGGGQQGGLRAGTENVLGAKLAELALSDVSSIDMISIENMRNEIETLFKKNIEQLGCVVGEFSQFGRLSNTSLLSFYIHKSDFLLASFDLAGLDVSMGSACSSGSMKESRVLSNMGHEFKRNSIRVSLGQDNISVKHEILNKFSSVLSKLKT